MKHLKLSAAIFIFSLFVFAGCKKDMRSDSQINASDVQSSAKLSAKQLHKLVTNLPTNAKERITVNAKFFINLHPQYRNMIEHALKVIEPTACDPNTPLIVWLDDQLSDWTDDIIIMALYTGMLDFPTYDALLFENSSDNQYFGLNGEFTHIETKTFKDLKRFWSIQTNNLVLVAIHGSMLLNRDRVIRIDRILYNDSPEVAAYYADLIIYLLNNVPQYRHGDHPIFTFNSFAQPGFNFKPYDHVPPKIVMGDGVLEGYAAIGFDDVAPQAVTAHEFGHHIQFQLGLYGSEVTPEATRKNELMADAFAAYYLSHARGASMQWKRVNQFLQVFFNVGDCQFNDAGHHGTPTQRMAAAEFGYSVANNAHKQGHIMDPREFVSLFNKALPDILAH